MAFCSLRWYGHSSYSSLWNFISTQSTLWLATDFSTKFYHFSRSRLIPSGQNRQKNTMKKCVFVNYSAIIVKNTLLQTVFSTILPIGLGQIFFPRKFLAPLFVIFLLIVYFFVNFCVQVSTIALIVGCTILYGALFGKTWRIYRIFTSSRHNKKMVRNRGFSLKSGYFCDRLII